MMAKAQETYEDIICKILLLERDMISNDVTQEDLEVWDSMTHLALVSELEQAFNIFLSDDDILEIKTIGDIKKILGKYGIKVI
ncbi:MAG: acyl carrier protein [Candidatus Heimdallarchaeota archaeon]|nr:MAG: acyl carrier protein [Candidatus Heimdallarchaeota archaeon]